MPQLGEALLLGLALGACGGGSNSGTAPAPAKPGTFTNVYTTLFPANTPAKCDSCHSQPASIISNGNFHVGADGDQVAAYQSLTTGSSASKKCMGLPFVVPGDPEGSLLYTKVANTPPCGERMPLGGGALPAADVEMIRSWIANGAQDD